MALQRAAGNAAVGVALVRTSPAAQAPLPVQRAAYLANADENIYKDSDDDSREMAYLAASKPAVFVDYAAVARVQQDKWLIAQAALVSERRFNKGVECEVVDKTQEGERLASLLGNTYLLDSDGKLKKVQYASAVVAEAIIKLFRFGSAYLELSRSSRLPKAMGMLFHRSDVTADQMLARIGIAPGDVGQVRTTPCNEYIMSSLWKEAQGKPGPAYPFWLDVDDRGTGKLPDALYVSGVEASRSRSHRVRIEGATYVDDLSDAPGPAALEAKFKALGGAASSDWIPGTQLDNPVDRGAGQDVAMGKWNALAAVAYGLKAGLLSGVDLDQGWEWLHLRGAQLGGLTKPGNLVPGTFAANSLMIPYENFVRDWARQGPTTFWARFTVEDNIGGTVLAKKLGIWVAARDHPTLGTLPAQLLLSFDPLHGRVVDKFAGELIKREVDARVRAP